MSCHQPTLDALRGAGFRLTPQRAMIAEALHHLGGHVTAEQVAEHVQRQYPYVDLSTVYRTLELLAELGLARAFDTGDGPMTFEVAEVPHHHLVCTECGQMEALATTEMVPLEQQLRQTYGFEANLQHLAIPGRCRACAARPSPSLRQSTEDES
jgi:Fur family ferric uptake transcriptional regulator